MPRTKLERSSRAKTKISTSRNMAKQVSPDRASTSQEDLLSFYLASFDRDVSINLLNMKHKISMVLEQIDQIAFQETSLIKPVDRKKTMKELRIEKSFSISSMKSVMFETATQFKHLNNTANTTSTANQTKKHIDDEAGESGTTNGDQYGGGKRTRSSSASRQSRQPTRSTRVTRTSRSLSRSQVAPPKKNVTIHAPEKKTPEKAMRPPLAFGMVTPKVKPNMPVSVFRRPMQGEMAISMQGSPLLVSGVVTETCANVNIPLQDGKILSLQPNRGLRMSEIPYFDEETRKQLTTLRDNLNKVVKLAYDK